MSNPYQAPSAELSPTVRPETLQRRTTAARLSGVGLSILLIGGGFWSLLLLGSLVNYTQATAPPGDFWLSVLVTLAASVITVSGGLSLWRLRPMARWLVLPVGLLSLIGMPLVPLLVGAVIWWAWSPAGRVVLSAEGTRLRADEAEEQPPRRQRLAWFMLGVAVMGAIQPLAFFVMMVLLV